MHNGLTDSRYAAEGELPTPLGRKQIRITGHLHKKQLPFQEDMPAAADAEPEPDKASEAAAQAELEENLEDEQDLEMFGNEEPMTGMALS